VLDRFLDNRFASISKTYRLRPSTTDLDEYVAAADAPLDFWELLEVLQDWHRSSWQQRSPDRCACVPMLVGTDPSGSAVSR
jgi:hypothetical protein